jgi:hypothetical protein
MFLQGIVATTKSILMGCHTPQHSWRTQKKKVKTSFAKGNQKCQLFLFFCFYNLRETCTKTLESRMAQEQERTLVIWCKENELPSMLFHSHNGRHVGGVIGESTDLSIWPKNSIFLWKLFWSFMQETKLGSWEFKLEKSKTKTQRKSAMENQMWIHIELPVGEGSWFLVQWGGLSPLNSTSWSFDFGLANSFVLE